MMLFDVNHVFPSFPHTFQPSGPIFKLTQKNSSLPLFPSFSTSKTNIRSYTTTLLHLTHDFMMLFDVIHVFPSFPHTFQPSGPILKLTQKNSSLPFFQVLALVKLIYDLILLLSYTSLMMSWCYLMLFMFFHPSPTLFSLRDPYSNQHKKLKFALFPRFSTYSTSKTNILSYTTTLSHLTHDFMMHGNLTLIGT